jgi:subtilisin family serine protease
VDRTDPASSLLVGQAVLETGRLHTIFGLRTGFLIAATALAAAAFAGPACAATASRELVVTLTAPPLANAIADSGALSPAAKARRLNLHTPTSAAYLDSLAGLQRTVARRIERSIAGTSIRWHYSVVVDGLAVSLPSRAIPRLGAIAGVARVYDGGSYRSEASALDRSPELIGAPALWGPTLATAGNGVKIGIVDDGLDQAHPFFSPAGYTMPAGFPKGQRPYTTAKVIVARAFAPRTPKWKYATRPFDPVLSEHATHVSGIAAGNHLVTAGARKNVSGVAPHAYLGNYKVLTIPTESNVGLDGNAPEIVAGIEAAVRDGMDVINLSLGEPEIEPGRDIVVQAINGAARAGVVPAIAAGNDFDEFGRGSVGSPGSAAGAITAAAATKTSRIADFSSAGPTPISLELKPDVTAPGVDIYSSIPPPELWTTLSGTSMAAPHVAGAAALLRERHPGWTVRQLKSSLVQTGTPIYANAANTIELPPTREGGGMIDLPKADNPLFFADPVSWSFGYLRSGASATRTTALTDAGGGAGTWSASVERTGSAGDVALSVPPTVSVPGTLQLQATAAASAAEGDTSGFVVLTRGSDRRRIPFWLRVEAPKLGREAHRTLTKTGTYRGSTRGRPSLVTTYRYPDDLSALGVRRELAGPEQVFRFRLTRRASNFGVAVTSEAAGVTIEPRVVVAGDENRLSGYDGLPVNLNPYLSRFLQKTLTAGALRPEPRTYDIVFDSAAPNTAGAFTFRFWVDDHTPPAIKLLTKRTTVGGTLRLRVVDHGSGVDGELLRPFIDGRFAPATYRKGVATVTPAVALKRGRHRLVMRASDYQETKNNENVGPILPNSRTLTATFTVR